MVREVARMRFWKREIRRRLAFEHFWLHRVLYCLRDRSFVGKETGFLVAWKASLSSYSILINLPNQQQPSCSIIHLSCIAFHSKPIL